MEDRYEIKDNELNKANGGAGTIASCYDSCDRKTEGTYVGGVCGNNTGSDGNCTGSNSSVCGNNTGLIKNGNDSSNMYGGLVGSADCCGN